MAGSYSLYRCAVLSTSSGSLTAVLDRDSPIQILHLGINMGGHWYADDLEVDNHEYCEWRKVHINGEVSTSPPTAEELCNTFRYLAEQGYHDAIVTTISRTLSDAADMVEKIAAKVPELRVHVVDTGSCCMPEGFFALEAVRLLKEGKTPGEAVAYLERLKPDSHIVFGLATLKSLSAGGTLARLGASFGDWLGMRAILKFSQGNLERLDSVYDDEKMFEKVTEETQRLIEGCELKDLVVAGMYTGSADFYLQFANYFHQKTGLRLGDGVAVSPVVAAHVGISGIGVGIVKKQN